MRRHIYLHGNAAAATKDAGTTGRTIASESMTSFAGSRLYAGKVIPAGTKVAKIQNGWAVAMLADVVRILGGGDFVRHDAEHYHMWVHPDNVKVDGANDADRQPDQSDIVAAQRGLNMVGMSLADLEDLKIDHRGKTAFASRVIMLAIEQMIAAKRRAGARDARNHLGEREYQTYGAWRAAAKAAGATRFEGDKDIASAFGPDGKGIGEWGGDKGSIYTKDSWHGKLKELMASEGGEPGDSPEQKQAWAKAKRALESGNEAIMQNAYRELQAAEGGPRDSYDASPRASAISRLRSDLHLNETRLREQKERAQPDEQSVKAYEAAIVKLKAEIARLESGRVENDAAAKVRSNIIKIAAVARRVRDSILSIGDTVRARRSAQGMVEGKEYTITDVQELSYGIFGAMTKYQLDNRLWITNGHLLLERM